LVLESLEKHIMGEGAFGSDGKNRGRRRLLMTKEEFL